MSSEKFMDGREAERTKNGRLQCGLPFIIGYSKFVIPLKCKAQAIAEMFTKQIGEIWKPADVFGV